MTRFPCVRQSDSKDCAAAALTSLSHYHGLFVSLSQVRERVGVARTGADFVGVKQAAESLGFRAMWGRCKPDAVDVFPLPAIVHIGSLNDGHFVVLYERTADNVAISDPAAGRQRWTRSEFESRWSGHLLLASPGPDFCPSASKRHDRPLLWQLAWEQRSILARAVAAGGAIGCFGLASGFFVQLVLDRVLPSRQATLLAVAGVAALVLLGMRALYSLVSGYWLGHAGRRVEVDLSFALLRRLFDLPVRFFDRMPIGDLHQRTMDILAVQRAMTTALVMLTSDAVSLAAALIVLFFYNWQLTLVTILLLLLAFASVLLLRRPVQDKLQEWIRCQMNASTSFLDAIRAIRLIKGFGAEDLALERLMAAYIDFAQSGYRRNLWMTGAHVLGEFSTAAVSVVVLWVGTGFVLHGSLTVGQLLFYFSVLAFLLGPVQRASAVLFDLQEGRLAAERLSVLLATPPERARDTVARLPGCNGEIVFEGVQFGYEPRQPILQNIHLRIPAGSVVALVGETGAGKTTVANLIAGFYEPSLGRVLIDGCDLATLDLGSYRQHLGVVFQDSYVLNDTIRANIALGKPDATFGEIVAAARIAQVDEFVRVLPLAYYSQVGERGVLLSSGQCQRIAIARAILRNPAIMILDETTNNLDSITEQAILDALWTARRGRTTIVIAHRLSTIRRADRILVLHRGEIVESGSHEELIAQRGRYERYWSKQEYGEQRVALG